MNLEERVAILEEELNRTRGELQCALSRIAVLEGIAQKSESAGMRNLPYTYQIPGFKPESLVEVFVAMDKKGYLLKKDALIYLGLSRSTGFALFDEWEKKELVHVESFVGNRNYILLDEIERIKRMLYSPKSKAFPEEVS